MTTGFILQLGLSWQSYAIIFLIVFWTGLLIVTIALLYNHILKERFQRKKTKKEKKRL
ncbi:MAG: hypothetical protein HZR80_01570 [Candidatus Heimdallarchaeota archaeon]